MIKNKKKMTVFLSILGIVVLLLVCNFKDVQNYRWCTKLVHAIEVNNMTKVERLLSKPGMDINREGNIFLQIFFGNECSPSTPFEAALWSHELEMMEKVLAYDGAIPFSDEVNPVCWIIYTVKGNAGTWEERHEIIRLMFEKGFDYDYIPECGCSTLCAIAGEEVVFYDTKRYNQERAEAVLALYQFASEQSQVKKQVDIDDGDTPLHCAAEGSNLLLIKYLVEEQQYSVNDTTNEGETPLIYLAKYQLPYDGMVSNAKEVIEYCIEQGADLAVRDVEGKTAYDYAIDAGYADIAEMLKVEED